MRRSIFAPTTETLRLSSAPVATIGLADDVPLRFVRHGVFLPEGGFALSNGDEFEVLIFDGGGELIASQGREGEGPGDYALLRGVARFAPGAGLLAWDALGRRFTVVSSSGERVRSTGIDHHPGSFRSTFMGAVGRHALLHHEPLGFPGQGSVRPREVREDDILTAYDLETGEVAWEVRYPGAERWVARVEDGPHGSIPIFFGRSVLSATVGGRAYVADTGSPVLVELDEAGQTRELALPHDPVPVREEWESDLREAYAEVQLPGPPGIIEFNRRLYESVPARDTLPLFSGLRGGVDGRLWVRSYPLLADDSVTWVALEDAHEPVQWVRMPRGPRVLDWAEDRVLVLDRGPLEEEVVMVYHLVPGT